MILSLTSTDPSEADGTGEIDFQAVIRHELVHMLGFTSNSRSNGSDDSGNGIITPGTWAPYDRFVSDLNGNRFINTDPNSPFVYQMDVTQWNAHSTGGAGPNAGLFFDGPIATAVYGGRVPLYSPANFSLSSSVSHLDSENYPSGDYQFSPRTHLIVSCDCHWRITTRTDTDGESNTCGYRNDAAGGRATNNHGTPWYLCRKPTPPMALPVRTKPFWTF